MPDPFARTALASLNRWGQPATYIDADGLPRSGVTVRLIHGVQVVGDYGQIVEQRTELEVAAADVPAPRRGDQILVGADSWTVEGPSRESIPNPHLHRVVVRR